MSTMNAQLPGVFYRRPTPDHAPFVEVGGKVEPGQTIALIEVMKTYNEVKADRSGTVSRILLDDGDEVEAGQGIVEVDEV
ncbi:acetyl-CoA carboxylase [Actinopolyspora mortivallis]|uniref:Biotin carboxyl carrier protein of acetyl-CoA carboxylase n=1 Tax=Actinopolyspora mortivallis TaxID=33906 RepID=A0A2T0GYY7_ACTMO|nr:acetyl-CoA carboxylase [Actinopolyspora mortivallis]PRW64314.1 biotin carboxyl carrier domain-containing protein [Actinopolyspora mortivallis]